ncbi:SRPBCC family protein, partial [Streptomyces sp. NPDC046984]|uniref:SRPBCC family protein n=1 Tax=Streptomyces sp. NPDC046984 TaxID=3155138 RepID=UPI0033F0C626
MGVARNRRLILSSPSEVWSLLSDGHRYSEWVTGNQQVLTADPHWPDVGARLQLRVGVGPLALEDTCVVRVSVPERRLELEAKAGPFGAARIAMNLIPWGENTLLILDWHPLRGPGTRMHGVPVDYFMAIRNGMMLTAQSNGLPCPHSPRRPLRPAGRHLRGDHTQSVD